VDLRLPILDAVEDPANGFLSVHLPVHQGVLLCLKLG